MKKYLIDKTGIHELSKEKRTKKHLRKFRYLGHSNLYKTGERVKVFGSSK